MTNSQPELKTDYLKNDCLKFRISEVVVESV